MSEQHAHVVTIQLTTKDDETIELDFSTELEAMIIVENLRQHRPMNLQSMTILTNVFCADSWEADPRKVTERMQ